MNLPKILTIKNFQSGMKLSEIDFFNPGKLGRLSQRVRGQYAAVVFENYIAYLCVFLPCRFRRVALRTETEIYNRGPHNLHNLTDDIVLELL